MIKTNILEKISVRSILLAACVVALAAAFLAARPQPAYADQITPPPVPGIIAAPQGYKVFFEAHAVGTQNYICLFSGSSYSWTFYGPQATLFDGENEQVATHFLSPNPDQGGAGRATWQHSRDTSAVWAVMIQFSTDSAYVAPDAIPWFLLDVVGNQDGPTGGDKLSAAEYIQRVNTTGGLAPTAGCSQPGHIGAKAFVPYTADYYFYK